MGGFTHNQAQEFITGLGNEMIAGVIRGSFVPLPSKHIEKKDTENKEKVEKVEPPTETIPETNIVPEIPVVPEVAEIKIEEKVETQVKEEGAKGNCSPFKIMKWIKNWTNLKMKM